MRTKRVVNYYSLIFFYLAFSGCVFSDQLNVIVNIVDRFIIEMKRFTNQITKFQSLKIKHSSDMQNNLNSI